MTDVLIHRAVPGHRAGAIVPHERWMESHIGAGNIIVLPEDVQAEEVEPTPSWRDAPIDDQTAMVYDDLPGDEEE